MNRREVGAYVAFLVVALLMALGAGRIARDSAVAQSRDERARACALSVRSRVAFRTYLADAVTDAAQQTAVLKAFPPLACDSEGVPIQR